MNKAITIFNQTSDAGRAAGWSETWYHDGTIDATKAAMEQVHGNRVGMLGAQAKIVGMRISTIGGRSKVFRSLVIGARIPQSDVPDMSINCYVDGDVATTRKYFQLRGVPDARVERGDFVFGQDFENAFKFYGNSLAENAFRFRAIDKTQPQVNLLGIGADGTFVLEAELAFNVNDILLLNRVRDSNGRAVRGNFVVIEKTNAQTGKFGAWVPGRVVGRSGKVRKLAYVFPIVVRETITRNTVTRRKVGRPFDSYRGRVTRRR